MHSCLCIKINSFLHVLELFYSYALTTYYVSGIMQTLSQFSQQPCKEGLPHLTNEKTDAQAS